MPANLQELKKSGKPQPRLRRLRLASATIGRRPIRGGAALCQFLGHFDGGFRQLLGNSEHMLAPLHFAPDVLGPHTGRRPQDGEIIEQVGALADHGVGIAGDGVDHDLDGFFGQFLGHLGRAALKQPRGSRSCRIEILGRDHRQIEPLERITHPPKLAETGGQRVNGLALFAAIPKNSPVSAGRPPDDAFLEPVLAAPAARPTGLVSRSGT